MSFSRCFSSLGCPELSIDDTFALAASHGVPAVELRALMGSADLPRVLETLYGSPEQLAPVLRGSPVRIVAFNTSLRLVGATAGEREEFLAFVPWAEALGVPWLRVFDGGKTADAVELAEMAETVRWWRALRREHGWQADLMIETHDSLFAAETIARFLAVVPDAAILWDAHHTWKKGGEAPPVTWAAIRPSVVHVHVKDSISVPSARHLFTYVLPGEGEFPIAPLLAALRDTDYGGCVSLEWERMWHPYLPPLDEALTVAAKHHWW